MDAAHPIRIERPAIYATPDGKALRVTVYRPRDTDAERRPAVLLIHGGGWIGGMRQQLCWYGRRLAHHGFVAAAVEYRRMFRWAFPHCLHDVKAAVRWLRIHADRYGVDTDSIAALGNSAGAHLACMLAATRPEHGLEGEENPGVSSAVQAAVCLYGPQDLTYYLAPGGPLRAVAPISAWYISHFAERDEQAGENALALASPLTYFDERTAPILFIHGTRDWLAPYAQTQAAHQRLIECGVYSEYVTVEGRNHAFDFIHAADRERCFIRILEFFGRTMAPDQKPVPVVDGHG